MEKKIVIVVGCIVLYFILSLLTHGAIRIVLIGAGLGYAIYKLG